MDKTKWHVSANRKIETDGASATFYEVITFTVDSVNIISATRLAVSEAQRQNAVVYSIRTDRDYLQQIN